MENADISVNSMTNYLAKQTEQIRKIKIKESKAARVKGKNSQTAEGRPDKRAKTNPAPENKTSKQTELKLKETSATPKLTPTGFRKTRMWQSLCYHLYPTMFTWKSLHTLSQPPHQGLPIFPAAPDARIDLLDPNFNGLNFMNHHFMNPRRLT